MKMAIYILCFVLVGCWVREEDPTDPYRSKEENREENTPELVPGQTPVSADPVKCFQKFKSACEQKQWKIAYDLLCKEWRARKTFEEFQENMEKVGYQHIKGTRIISILQLKNQKGETRWNIIVTDNANNQTRYVIVQENDQWKIGGVKNLPPYIPLFE